MPRRSPLIERHRAADAPLVAYGPPDENGHQAEVVETFDRDAGIEYEYAAIRHGCCLIDLPHRGSILVDGDERIPFLQRMLTQQLQGPIPLTTGGVRHAFWLDRKGRIAADLTLAELPDDPLEPGEHRGRMLIDLDVLVAADTVRSLSEYLFSEDVTIADATSRLHRLGLYGPDAPAVLDAAAGRPLAPPLDGASIAAIAGAAVAVFRRDWPGSPGLELAVSADAVADVWDALCATSGPSGPPRPAGWLAFNTARIEAGTPLFGIDFGPQHLPAETGLLDSRVSFTKGCYLGQEVVARMHARGGLKHRLVALKIGGQELFDASGVPRQPVGGAQLLHDGSPVGQITSSTPSPALNGIPVAFAFVRAAHAEPGTVLDVPADGAMLKAIVQDGFSPIRGV